MVTTNSIGNSPSVVIASKVLAGAVLVRVLGVSTWVKRSHLAYKSPDGLCQSFTATGTWGSHNRVLHYRLKVWIGLLTLLGLKFVYRL